MQLKYFFTLLGLFAFFNVVAQEIPNFPSRGQNQNFGDPEFGGFEQDTAATTKKDEKGRLLLEPVPEEIYSTRTSGFVYEQDWLLNRKTEHYFDTTLHNLHRYNFVDKNNFMYQDLGNFGTAIKPIFYHLNTDIGVRFGINSIEPYLHSPDKIQYLDTKSPFTSWHYVQGAAGRSIIDVHHSQNIKPNWNAGIRIYRLNARLLVGTEPANQNDRQVTHENYIFKTRYESPNARYRLLFHAQSLRHLMAETGGLQLSSTDSLLLDRPSRALRDTDILDIESLDELFGFNGAQLSNRLNDVESLQRNDQLRLYHEYTFLGRQGLQLFHVFDYSRRKYKYFDESFNSDSSYYKTFSQIPFTPATTYTHTQRLNQLSNTIGLKGRADKLFYLFYLKQQNFRYHFQIAPEIQIPRELPAQQFIGFKGTYDLSDKIRFRIDYEGILGTDTGVKIYGEMKTPYFTLEHRRWAAEPTLLQQYYFGQIFQWDNTRLEDPGDEFGGRRLNSTSHTESKISAPLLNKKVVLRPFAQFATFDDYIYFDTLALPSQYDQTITILQAGLEMETHFNWFHQRFLGMYTVNDTEEIMRMPTLFANYQVYYQGNPFNFPILIQTGLDLHWHDAFFADSFMPVTQQFYLQDWHQLGNYLRGDIFLNFQMKKVVMFLKMTNALQGVQRAGSFSTPFYMTQPRSFEFGVTWLLYD